MSTNIIVQGHSVNNAVVSAYAKRVTSITEVLSVWANASAIEASKGNLNWATKLFSTLTLKSGDLNKQGKEVLAYIQRHYPLLVWDKVNKKIGRKDQKADSVFNTLFLSPTVSPSQEGVINHNGKLYLPVGDFELTLSQFLNLDKPAKVDGPTEPSMPVKAFAKQANKALEFAEGQRLVGSADEFITAIAAAEALLKRLHAAHAATITQVAATEQRLADIDAAGPVAEVDPAMMPIDNAKAAELLKSGQAGKSQRAGGKVEDKKVAA